MLAICAALGWEIGPILEAAGKVRRLSVDGVRAWRSEGEEALLVFRTGVGAEKAAASADAILRAFPLRSVLNTGSAGALVPSLPTGALVIPSACCQESKPLPTDPQWTERLRRIAVSLALRADHGPLLTSPEPLLRSSQKRDAHLRWKATAVDMESAAIGRVAAENGVPFAVVRGILDPLDANLLDPGDAAPDSARPARRLKLNWRRFGQDCHIPRVPEDATAAQAVRAGLRLLFAALLHRPPNRGTV
jgi:nucleoside phosphorylase